MGGTKMYKHLTMACLMALCMISLCYSSQTDFRSAQINEVEETCKVIKSLWNPNIVINTTEQFEEFVENASDPYIIFPTSKNCEYCCLGELLILQLADVKANDMFDIAEIRMAKFKDVEEIKSQFKEFGNQPTLYVYDNDDRAVISGYYDYSTFLHLLNKFLHPLADIVSEEDADRFINTELPYPETTDFCTDLCEGQDEYFEVLNTVIRVLAIAPDHAEFEGRLDAYNEIASIYSDKIDIRFGIVEDFEGVEGMQDEYCGSSRGDPEDTNCIVIFKKDHQDNIKKYVKPMGEVDEHLDEWINNNIIDPLELLTLETIQTLQIKSQVTLIAFLDRNDPDQESKSDQLYKSIEKLSQLGAPVSILYLEGPLYNDVRSVFGIDWVDKPAVGIIDFDNEKVHSYPEDTPFLYKELVRWLNKNIIMKDKGITFDDPAVEPEEEPKKHHTRGTTKRGTKKDPKEDQAKTGRGRAKKTEEVRKPKAKTVKEEAKPKATPKVKKVTHEPKKTQEQETKGKPKRAEPKTGGRAKKNEPTKRAASSRDRTRRTTKR